MNTIKDEYLRLLLLLSPVRMRRGFYTVFCRSLAAAAATLHNGFNLFKDSTSYRLAHNSQVCYLTAAINDAAGGGCSIVPPEVSTTGLLLHRRDNGSVVPFMLGKRGGGICRIITRRDSRSVAGIDFIVRIPKGQDTPALRSIINTYKLTSKRYNITEI